MIKYMGSLKQCPTGVPQNVQNCFVEMAHFHDLGTLSRLFVQKISLFYSI